MVYLKCKRCSNTWNYKGANKFCANCSKCKTTVYLRTCKIPDPSSLTIKENENK